MDEAPSSHADRNCPEVRLGPSRAGDFAKLATAVAALERAGYIADDQRAWIDSEILKWKVRERGTTPESKARIAPGTENDDPDSAAA